MMEEFSNLLLQNRNTVKGIGDKIENHEAYIEDIKEYLPSLNSEFLHVSPPGGSDAEVHSPRPR